MTLTLDGQPALALLLASVRIIAWLAVVPPFSSRSVPAMAKVVLSLGLAFAVAPQLGESAIPVDTFGFIVTVLTQVAVGALSVRFRGIRLKDLRKGGSLAREATSHVAHEAVQPVHTPG